MILMKPSNFKNQRGMTLIELMASTVILAIIVSIAIPNMQSLLTSNSIKTVAPFFVKTIELARTEARKYDSIVRVMPKFHNNDASLDWSKGWLIEVTNPITNLNETLHTFETLPGSPIFTSNTFSRNTPMQLLPNGQAVILGNFDMYYQGCKGKQRIGYELMVSGRLKKETSVCP